VIFSVCLTVKPVGEPDAGDRHVRFDERGWETERCRMAQATAPILDSTSATYSQLMGDRRFRGKADILRSGPVYERLEVCYLFGRKHAREHMFDWFAHRLLS
jgi:hypothetical protein